MRHLRRLVAGGVLTLAALSPWASAVADSSPATSIGERSDAGSDADVAGDARAVSPDVRALELATAAIEALIEGHFDAGVSAATLFDVRLDDEDAVQVDAARLRALLGAVDETSTPAAVAGPRERAGASDDAAADGTPVDPALWRARLALDRARLAFYELPASRRAALLPIAREAPGDAGRRSAVDRRAGEAAAQRAAALLEAKTARTEADRLVATELARLLDVERAQSDFAAALAHDKVENAQRDDATLGWRRRTVDAQTGGDPASADRTYDDLRRALRAARDSLSTALAELLDPPQDVPEPGADPLAALRVDVDTSAIQTERDRLESDGHNLEIEGATVRRERAARLFAAIDSLNADRLDLLPVLTPAKRAQVTGFTLDGWEQAAAEVRQLTLVARYHWHIIGEWLGQLRHPDRALESTLAGAALPLIELLGAAFFFLWWRRRSTGVIVTLRQRLEEGDGRSRLEAPSPAVRAVVFLAQVHRPLEWLLFLLATVWVLPQALLDILEVRLATVMVAWIFGAALIVDAINAVAGTARDARIGQGRVDTSVLRLRSLRLVARVVVAFGLILSLSSRLVGRGAIFHWVFSTCWVASLPLVLLLVRWWRETVFHRTELIRRPSVAERWVLQHRTGWTSFAAALVAGADLFVSGGVRAGRNWVGRFVITRRALAYLFRRQLGRRTEKADPADPLDARAYAALGPEQDASGWIETDAEAALEALAARIHGGHGGIVAIVGERGMGKTAVLQRTMTRAAGECLLVDSVATSGAARLEQVRTRLAAKLGLPEATDLERVATALAGSSSVHALLIDDAHRFVQPVMGGLQAFDLLLGAASRNASTFTWVFTLDSVIWPFLERARGARPLFDEVIHLGAWREPEVVRLLDERTQVAGLTPSFERLLDPLPPKADDVDKQEALVERAAEYYRLLWDYAAGNPGVALHMWRESLVTDAAGATSVRLFGALGAVDLERLPDGAVFVLRAILQLAPARPEQIALATLLRHGEVTDALRYALARGYIEEQDGGYRLTWTWFRTITLFLQRKHLLVR